MPLFKLMHLPLNVCSVLHVQGLVLIRNQLQRQIYIILKLITRLGMRIWPSPTNPRTFDTLVTTPLRLSNDERLDRY